MLIKSDFEVPQSIDKVWSFFDDIPQVAACLPGAELTDEQQSDDGAQRYLGRVGIRMGPVRLQFAGTATIVQRDEAAKKVVVDAAGADERGRGQASMLVTASLAPTASGTRVDVVQDLQLSGAAAQYGRGMISDVTSVLMRDFAGNMQRRIEAADRGLSPDQVANAAPASGFAIGLRAMRMALMRVFRRFFLPYQPTPS
jgi:carbon monoxide dehydrogenase subunit G